jgi:uncharacterized membrane protein
LGERLARDPAGNTLAIIVLLGMLLSTTGIVKLLRSGKKKLWNARPSLWIPVLCLAGGVVAGYLAYVETAQVQAVCGPVGDCNTVQQSQYARLFGVLPIGILGLVGYLAILATWLVGRYGAERPARLASQVMLGMTLCGVLFSIYLTFLEPFVIGATCAWCLSSALLMTALMCWLRFPRGLHLAHLSPDRLPHPRRRLDFSLPVKKCLADGLVFPCLHQLGRLFLIEWLRCFDTHIGVSLHCPESHQDEEQHQH